MFRRSKKYKLPVIFNVVPCFLSKTVVCMTIIRDLFNYSKVYRFINPFFQPTKFILAFASSRLLSDAAIWRLMSVTTPHFKQHQLQ